ncbi:MAG: hypothetical protein HKO05_01535 [Erythrobacter sp.]|nr:hypothetical protein [Erythrobacter sp.]
MGAKRRKAGSPPRNWRDLFLTELAQSSNVSRAARTAKVDTGTIYKTRRSDQAFARQWQEALAEGYDNLEVELLRRLRDGELEGGKAKERARRKYDNAIAFRLLAAHSDAVGRQRALRDDEDEEAILASIDAKLEAMRQQPSERCLPPIEYPRSSAKSTVLFFTRTERIAQFIVRLLTDPPICDILATDRCLCQLATV